jgi:hypothetical protein
MGQQGGNPMPWQSAQPLGQQGGMAAQQGGRGIMGQALQNPWGFMGQAQQGGGGWNQNSGTPYNPMSILGQAGNAGTFDPFGSPQLLEMLRQSGLSDMGARLNSNRLNVQLHGNDPYLQAYGSLMGNMGGQSDVFRALQQAQLQQALQSQEFWQGIYGQAQSLGVQQDIAKGERDSAAKARKQSGRNALISAGGQLGGALLGAKP